MNNTIRSTCILYFIILSVIDRNERQGTIFSITSKMIVTISIYEEFLSLFLRYLVKMVVAIQLVTDIQHLVLPVLRTNWKYILSSMLHMFSTSNHVRTTYLHYSTRSPSTKIINFSKIYAQLSTKFQIQDTTAIQFKAVTLENP